MKLPARAKSKIFFTTRDLAFELKKNINSVSRSLNLLAQSGEITKITRGVWANLDHRYFSPYALVPTLLGTEQGYVSFLSALHRHDIISQVPQVIQIATTGRNRILQSEVCEFDFIHLDPRLMKEGFEVWGD